MKIRPYETGDYGRLVTFLKKNWAPTHALYDRALFDWQYRHDRPSHSQIVENNEQILGFLGVIWNDYLLRGEAVTGAALALWVVAEEYRQSGLGVMLIREALATHRVALTLRCNKTVLPLFQRMGFSSVPALNRSVLPLDARGYHQLLEDPGTVSLSDIEDWCRTTKLPSTQASTSPEYKPDPNELEKLFNRTVRPSFSLTVFRNAEYWRWRYLQHPSFRYRFFGDPLGEGVVVARIETVLEDSQTKDLRVFRLIELLPNDPAVFRGKKNNSFTLFLKQVLAQARDAGCVAVDFQCSHNRLAETLTEIGFINQENAESPNSSHLARLFQPFRRGAAPINAVWHTGADPSHLVDINDTYLMKSDGDMDRPRTT